MIKVAIVSIAILVGTLSANATTYTINSWPEDLEKVPCDAWTHNQDGSWTQSATIMVGTNTMSGNTFKGTGETRLLDAKCGAK
jgi:hypothetical protein